MGRPRLPPSDDPDVNRKRARYREYAHARYQSDPLAQYWKNLKHQTGVTPELWWALWLEQDGLCPLCQRGLYLPGRPQAAMECTALDHDHEFLTPRGLLHRRCNLALAAIENGTIDEVFVARAHQYLINAKW